ncbi:GNAT family N-acetyltransferase [Cellulomonas soli]|nr:GNAT family N-acetyltransferase [Cellulomonas soli]NYI58740.1 GNAT superfamily N-acetyltransferase [Cellulomonas soli]
MPMIDCPDGYEFSAERARLDPAWVHAALVEHAYWAVGRSRSTQDTAIDGSRNYGIYVSGSRRQVAYARVVTDGVTFGWLADVLVDPAHRGRGLGRALVTGIVADLDPAGLKRILLKASPEGRALYEKLGWAQVSEPDSWMERRRPSP